MTVSSAELVSAVAKLNDLTRRRALTWSIAGNDNDATGSYCAPYEGRTFRITEAQPSAAERRYNRDARNHHKLEILNDQGNSIFVFPDIQGIDDLYATVRSRTGNAEDVIRSLLSAK